MEHNFNLFKTNISIAVAAILMLFCFSGCSRLETTPFEPKHPVARTINLSLVKNGQISFNIADSVRPQVFSTLTLSAPKNGVIYFDTTSKLHTYQPINSFVGRDSATYEICQNGICAKGIIAIVVSAGSGPNPNNCVLNSWAGLRLLNVNNPDTFSLEQYHSICTKFDDYQYSVVTGPENGECFQAYATGASSRKTWVYHPNANFSGNDSVTIRVTANSLTNPAVAPQTSNFTVRFQVRSPANDCENITNLLSDTLRVNFSQLATQDQSFIVNVEHRLQRHSTFCPDYEIDRSRISLFPRRILFPAGVLWGPVYGTISLAPFGDRMKVKYTPLPGLSSALPVMDSFRVKIWLINRSTNHQNTSSFEKEVTIFLMLTP